MDDKTQTTTAAEMVSVIVPTRNSAETLARCLESVRAQDYRSIELIVVDNHSDDATVEIAHASTSHLYSIGPERSAQRNAGVQRARGSYVVFVDSDMVLAHNVISSCVEALRADASATGVIIPERSLGSGFWARCKALERSCYVGDDTIEAARFFHRRLFIELGGYNEQLTGPEDWDLSQRAAARGHLLHATAFITHLEGPLTLGETMRSKFYYGRTMGQYLQTRPHQAAGQAQLIRPAFVRHWRRLVMQPHLLAGMAAMKLCEFAAAAVGVVWSGWPLKRTTRAA